MSARATARAKGQALLLGGALAVCALLLLALRLPEFSRPFDRQFDGFQGAFFATAAVSYHRPQTAPFWPYPIVQVDFPESFEGSGYLYANHPPLVPLLAGASANLFGERGWSERWRDGEPPVGIEGALRAPFVLAQVLSALLLALCLRTLGAGLGSWAAAVVFLSLPGALVYAGLVNYENPSLLATLLAAFGLARVVRAGGWTPVDLGILVGAGLLAGATTYMPAIFLPGLVVWCWRKVGRAALGPAVALALGLLAALLAHAVLATRALSALDRPAAPLLERILELMGPLWRGEPPIGVWLTTQATVLGDHIGPLALGLGLLGLWLAWFPRAKLLRSLGAQGSPDAKSWALGFSLCLVLGGALVQVAFYRHTADPQEPFALHLAPGVAALCGLALGHLAKRQGALAALLLVATTSAGAVGSLRLAEPWRAVDRERPGPLELGTAIAAHVPPGALVWYPSALGFTPAVSYYAWRTLLPVEPPLYGAPGPVAAGLGLADAPVYLAEPRGVLAEPEGVRIQCEVLARDLKELLPQASLVAEDPWFRIWRLRR